MVLILLEKMMILKKKEEFYMLELLGQKKIVSFLMLIKGILKEK